MEKVRCNLTLDSDVIEMLDELAGSERKRGLWLSNMIRTTYAAQRSNCLLYTSPSPRDGLLSRMPSSA